MAGSCALGLDFGTNSVRALIVGIATGRELGEGVYHFQSGERGIVLDPAAPLLARQDPADYLRGLEASVRVALEAATATGDFAASDVVGIGVDATASTPMPVDAAGTPLALSERFEGNPAAMAWLWKDHTATAEAEEIASLARHIRPAYPGKTGGAYSSEWFWAKALRCTRTAPEVFAACASWVDACDWIPALLAGDTRPESLRRSACAAGHKGLYHPLWGGWPDRDFLAALDPGLARIRPSFQAQAFPIGSVAGTLCPEWADRLGLPTGIALSVGSVDAHVGAIGAGIAPGVLVKVIGTSGVDMAIADSAMPLPDIPGLAGVIPDSILPGYYGLEAGQSAVGDIYGWFTDLTASGQGHEALQAEAQNLAPGASGLLALDWHNGNRTILMDQRLTGMILGLTLRSTRAEIYRALVEATAFGSRAIIEHFEASGARIDRVVAGGGIALKSPMTMGIFADVLGKDIQIARSSQTGALGAAIAGAVAASLVAHNQILSTRESFASAIATMVAPPVLRYSPDPRNTAAYDQLFALYRDLHDAFGRSGARIDLSSAMKRLIDLRDRVRDSA